MAQIYLLLLLLLLLLLEELNKLYLAKISVIDTNSVAVKCLVVYDVIG